MTMPTHSHIAVLDGLDLPILRACVTIRLLEDTSLPAAKGAMLRGGFGYAFQRSACPQSCWGHSDQCAAAALCPYRWVFETPHPPGIQQLHDLHDLPRPFVIEPPHDDRTRYAAGDALEFGLVLIGRGIDPFAVFPNGAAHNEAGRRRRRRSIARRARERARRAASGEFGACGQGVCVWAWRVCAGGGGVRGDTVNNTMKFVSIGCITPERRRCRSTLPWWPKPNTRSIRKMARRSGGRQ